MKSRLLMLASGMVFGVGLLVSGMTDPGKVIGFLDVFGRWDPSLAFVMLGAIAVHFVLLRLILRSPKPLLGGAFQIPTRTAIDARLVAGAAIFGIGWGASGMCPGPALVDAASGSVYALVFVAGMTAGVLAERRVFPRSAA